jgi:hypothetical protein
MIRSVSATQRVAEGQGSVMRNQYQNEQGMIQKDITREELRELVEEYLANGGKITQCPPGVAYDLRSDNVHRISKSVRSKRTSAPVIRVFLHKKTA